MLMEMARAWPASSARKMVVSYGFPTGSTRKKWINMYEDVTVCWGTISVGIAC